MINNAIDQLDKGQDLEATLMRQCVLEIMTGNVDQVTIQEFLSGLHHKGESIEEVVGAARAMREQMLPANFSQASLVDTCGTGGDGSMTFNISTAAAIVAAAAGAKVAKHGNRKITSQSGSADVLSELGVAISCDVKVAQNCLDQAGVCFLFAPQFHPAMRHVAVARKNLPFPTIFNLLGPLLNPASVPHQVLGIGKAEAWDLLVPALCKLSHGRCIVVRGQDGLGELTVLAPTSVAIIQNGAQTTEIWNASDFGLGGGKLSDLQVETPTQSAALIHSLLAGANGTPRNMVIWNAAAAVWVSGVTNALPQAIKLCQDAIDSGQAATTLNTLVQVSNR